MDLQPPVRVTLNGGRSGDYLVVEERSDGTLVLAPDPSPRPAPPIPPAPPERSAAAPPARRPASPIGTLLSGLRRPADTLPASDAEVLEGWGLEIGTGERIREVFVADVDEKEGFVAITSDRFVFAAGAGRGRTAVEQHRLSRVRGVEMVRRGIRQKLRVSWDGAESLVGVVDRSALSRLQGYLEQAQGPSASP